MAKIELTVRSFKEETKSFKVVSEAMVPGWVSASVCPLCLWHLHEDAKTNTRIPPESITALKLDNDDVIFVHNNCRDWRNGEK